MGIVLGAERIQFTKMHSYPDLNAGGRNRTYAGTNPQDLKSCPFGHSGTPAYKLNKKAAYKFY